jgi:hypothetical protein
MHREYTPRKRVFKVPTIGLALQRGRELIAGRFYPISLFTQESFSNLIGYRRLNETGTLFFLDSL